MLKFLVVVGSEGALVLVAGGFTGSMRVGRRTWSVGGVSCRLSVINLLLGSSEVSVETLGCGTIPRPIRLWWNGLLGLGYRLMRCPADSPTDLFVEIFFTFRER